MINEGRKISYRQAINECLSEALASDNRIILLGEDISFWGGRYDVTKGLSKRFGQERLLDTPLIEDMIVGVGLGLALGGFRPVVELMYGTFLTLAMDDIYRVATWRFRYPETPPIPLVIRCPHGGYDGRGQEFSASFMAWFQHIPNLILLSPATPYDAKGLLWAAIESRRPVLFFEDKKLYSVEGVAPSHKYTVPVGKSNIIVEGKDLTILACGYMVALALEVAAKLAEKDIRAEVIDLRTVVPLDEELLAASVKKTKRAVILEQGIVRGGIGAEIGARLVERDGSVAIKRIGAPNVPPAPLQWEAYTLPSPDSIFRAIEKWIN